MGKKKNESAANLSTRGLTTKGKGDGGTVQREEGAPRPKKVRRNRGGIQGVPGSANDSRRCKATVKSTGERCKRAAIKGGTVCTSHGGAAPQVQKSAKERLLELADPAIAALSKIVKDEDADDSVRLRAALGICDRIGLGPGQTVTVQASKFDELLQGVTSLDVDRSLPRRNDRPALDGGGGDHSWEDVEQVAVDAQADAWSEYDDEDAQTYEAGRIRPDAHTVRGEVIPTQSRYDVRRDQGPTDPPRYAEDS